MNSPVLKTRVQQIKKKKRKAAINRFSNDNYTSDP